MSAVDAQVRAVSTEFLRRRPMLVIPFLAFTVAVLAATGAPAGQVGALAIAATLFTAFFLHERRLGTTKVFGEPALFRSLVLTALGIMFGATATGALSSPLLPMLSAPIGIGFAAFGRTRRSGHLIGLLVAIVAFLFGVTPVVAPLVIADGPRRVILAAALVDAALLLHVGVGSLAEAHRRAAESLAVAGDDIVESAVARTRSLETMSAKVAHEVKNPLTAIKAIVEVMLEGGDERTRKRLDVAAGEIARLERIIDGYGSMKSPLESVHVEPIDVVPLLVRIVAVLEARAARAGIALFLRAPPSVTFPVDRNRLNEALLNLFLNALHATPSGGTITLACEVDAQSGLELRVIDTGKGMDEATLAKVGTPFFTRREGGTGLGVALARQVAEQHGGALTYESSPRTGTMAILRLPRPR